ncbi:hypothetical protein ACHAWT_006022 [Skeletonema menzelii]|mmetsp:Transcript_6908/g.11540  ORF Transcript_6908/g.11540 Transcript_6908/m.11540 type:complete len:92 (+) Transcript_6908:439-714(+)
MALENGRTTAGKSEKITLSVFMRRKNGRWSGRLMIKLKKYQRTDVVISLKTHSGWKVWHIILSIRLLLPVLHSKQLPSAWAKLVLYHTLFT